jgi:hypothetical protein
MNSARYLSGEKMMNDPARPALFPKSEVLEPIEN